MPSLVPAPCFRRACAKGRTARTPPPPASFSDAHPQKGRGRRGDRKKKKKNTKRATKDTNMPEQGQAAGADGTGREPGGTARGQGPWGRKQGSRDQRGGAG